MSDVSITVAGATVSFTLTPELIEAIAHEVMKLSGASTAEQPVWLTTKEAAAFLSWPVARIYKLSEAGAIPHRKHGQRLLFRRDELDAWLEGYAHGPSPRGLQLVSKAS